MKTCCNCKETFDLDKFYNDKSSKDGKCSRCKRCKDDSTRALKKKSINKEVIDKTIPYIKQKITTVEERHDYARRQAAIWLYD